MKCSLLCSMGTVSELVDRSDIPEERKDDVKKVLHDLGYAANSAVGKAFLKIAKKDMTDAGIRLADANAILAEVETDQGDLSLAELNRRWHSWLICLCCNLAKPLNTVFMTSWEILLLQACECAACLHLPH